MARIFSKILCSIALSAAMCACDSLIYDDLEPCEVRNLVTFSYDYNMKYADAFAHEVEGVTLYVAEAESGRIVKTYREQSEALKKDGFAIEIDVEPGDYTLLAWAGAETPASFAIPEGKTIKELTATMQRDYDAMMAAHQYNDIDRLFYGRLDLVTLPVPSAENAGVNIINMPLIKDTNSIVVTLQHLSGEEMDKAKFDVSIREANGALDWDNSLLDENEYITYHAWNVDNASAQIIPDESRAAMNAIVAELTVPRLMAARSDKAALIITNHDTGEVIVRLRLIDALLLSKRYYDRQMDDQEFLDRKDDYSLTFFLDSRDRWLSSLIYIESWKVVLQPDIIL